jgi:hypothetical protein
MKKKTIFIALVVFVSGLIACEDRSALEMENKLKDVDKGITELEKRSDEKPPEYPVAYTDEEYIKLAEDPNVNIIRSLEDFEKLVAEKPEEIGAFDSESLETFMKELQFRDGKLIGGNYGVTEKKLDPEALKRFWARFGLSLDLLDDHRYYHCESRANCKKVAYDNICMSTC